MELDEYFQEIERHFIRLRKRPLLLSPRDVEEIEHWHQEGIPLALVLRGMEAYFDGIQDKPAKLRRFASVLYCKNQILDIWERHLDRMVGAEAPATPATGARTPIEALQSIAAALDGAAGRAEPAHLEPLRAAHCSMVRLLRRHADIPEGKLEKSLEGIEKRFIKKILSTFEPGEAIRLEVGVREDLSSFRERLDPRVFDGLVRRGIQREVLERLGLPRFVLWL